MPSFCSFNRAVAKLPEMKAILRHQVIQAECYLIGERRDCIRERKSNINFLLTEREGFTGEYWPEVVAVRTERSEVRTKTTEGQYSPVRLELARLVSSLLYGFLSTFNYLLQARNRPVGITGE